ncbi:MAG: prepilin peptidase [Firmicutes bacterium]|nr:prepilin peptidase [Bacillota bacterium]
MEIINVVIIIITIACLIWIIYKDIKDRKIPNIMVLVLLMAGLYYQPHSVSLAGITACFCTMFPLYLLGLIGAGDVKLAGAVGAMLGLHAGLTVLLLASGLLAIWEAFKRARKGELKNWLIFNLNAVKMGVHVKYVAEVVKNQENVKKTGAPLGAFIAPISAALLLMNAVMY